MMNIEYEYEQRWDTNKSRMQSILNWNKYYRNKLRKKIDLYAQDVDGILQW